MAKTYRFDLVPCPASRPRFTKHGRPYFAGRYKDFRDRAAKVVSQVMGDHPPISGPLRVTCYFLVPKPKTTKRSYPLGDNDNYEKALWDVCNGKVWEDDDQIVRSTSEKMYCDPGSDGRIYMIVRPWSPRKVRKKRDSSTSQSTRRTAGRKPKVGRSAGRRLRKSVGG